ncbi:acetylgalactosamine 3-beta-galactosyltransferase 1 [Seminavis robusta]|uniref:Acetylgalactosamine 3-beta-galactosyltransferase 1 n=1 Tax=Seminavis robusta TaxID=568900 RepID=A0A9N8HJ97_9STRA|nr:acetylgalactosamine 3-beta-galactosyltransferase 1 [Seminavis robusta]|eukprot:Sro751_g197080.1 acetylgalactosamine 3-beta-galactosyltransferase 1 (472) ;mRNA; r:27904-29319
MASQLHERRKHHQHPDEEEACPDTPQQHRSSSTSPGGSLGGSKMNPILALARSLKNSKNKEGRNEVGAALMSVVSFLVVGFGLGYFLMHIQHRRVILHVMKNPWAHGGAVILRGRVGFQHHFYSGPPRYVTVVMPSVVNPKARPHRLRSIQDTWGPFARSIFVVSNVTLEFPPAKTHNAIISDNSEPGDPFSYPQALQIPAEIGDENGVARLQYVFKTIYEKVNPDYAFFVNDHTFVIPEHLCNYLQDLDPLEDLYAGHAMKTDKDVFNSGAAGYLLSRSTMKKLVEAWADKEPHCTIDPNNKQMKFLAGNPGLMTTVCLRDALNITAIDTREDSKYHRFHAFPLTRQVSGDVDEWYIKKHNVETARAIGADETYATMLTGEDCCAKSTVTFHYVEHAEARALFATRERLLANPHLTDKELMSLMMKEWPKNQKEIGAYSRPLPDSKNEKGWKALLRTVRKITTRETQRDC